MRICPNEEFLNLSIPSWSQQVGACIIFHAAFVPVGVVQLWGSHWSASPSLICKGVIYCQRLQDGEVARGSHVKCLNSSLIATDEKTAITLFTPQLFLFYSLIRIRSPVTNSGEKAAVHWCYSSV